MILRRITKGIKEQDWFVVGVEVMIVVVGIFVGLQVNEWNEERETRLKADENINRLIAELQLNKENWQNQSDYLQGVFESGEKTISLLNTSNPNPADLVFHAYRATEFILMPQTRATWDGIITSGEIGLLPLGQVRDNLFFFYGLDIATEAVNNIQGSPYRKRVRRLLPYNIQLHLRQYCSDTVLAAETFIGLTPSCDINETDDQIVEVANTLLGDEELIKDLRYHLSNLRSSLGNFQGTNPLIDSMIDALKSQSESSE